MSRTQTILACARAALPNLLVEFPTAAVISVESHPMGLPEPFDKAARLSAHQHPQLILTMNDTMAHEDGPKIEHVQQAWQFAKDHADRPLIMQCMLGQSRSTGLVLSILANRYKNPSQALCKFQQTCLLPTPNPDIIAMTDNLLHMRGQLIAGSTIVRETNQQIMLAQYALQNVLV